ncbi:hypothetical protein [Hyalangium sp.]|uniref:hypothetical protein n=1 Tax=Hyalangium sp. TaxID=2028555 RepID=UPI0039C89C87
MLIPSCGAKNRLPRFYLTGAPVCGRCGAGLPESALPRTARGAYQARSWILGVGALVTALTSPVVFPSRPLLPMAALLVLAAVLTAERCKPHKSVITPS